MRIEGLLSWLTYRVTSRHAYCEHSWQLLILPPCLAPLDHSTKSSAYMRGVIVVYGDWLLADLHINYIFGVALYSLAVISEARDALMV